MLSWQCFEVNIQNAFSLRHQGDLEPFIQFGGSAILSTANDYQFFDCLWVLESLVKLCHELLVGAHLDSWAESLSSRDVAFSFSQWAHPESDISWTLYAFMVDLFLPTVCFIIYILFHEIPEEGFIQTFGVIFGLTFAFDISTFDLEHLCFEFVEIGETE